MKADTYEISDERISSTVMVIKVSGRISSDIDEFERHLLPKADEGADIIFDCSNLDYINSYGLRVIFKLLKAITQKRRQMVFCSISGNIKDIMFITGFFQLFEVFADKEEALAFLNKGRQ
jgi:anti-anti-sigma factor